MTENRQSAALSPSPCLLRRQPRPLSPALTPAPLPRREGDLCGFADPSAGGEIRAASPIDRLEGSVVTEMVVNPFRKTQ